MDHVTDDYLEYIKDCAMKYDAAPSVICEVQVDFSAYVPGGYGTVELHHAGRWNDARDRL